MAGTKRVLCLTPQELERGEAPDPRVNGFHGGVRFEKGVSEPISYTEAQKFAARGNVVKPVDEADRIVEELRSEEDSPNEESERRFQDISMEDLEEAELPEDWDPPLYQDAYSEMSESVDVSGFFGGQPKKLPLMKLYYAWKHGPDALFAD